MGRQPEDDAGAVRPALQRFSRAREGQAALRPGPLWRRRSEVPDQDARLHRARLALAVHPPVADPSRALRARELCAGADHHRHAVVPARRQAPRRPRGLRHDGRHRFHPQDRADLRLVLRGRNQEGGVHHAELLPAGAGRDADALLGQRRQGRRQRAVLRPVRHRQDHAVGRSEPHADRRRRDRLVAERHLQLRGRLLRQDHQALEGSRAADLGRHQPLRRGAGERRVRSGDPHPGLRQRQEDREHRVRPIRSTSSRTRRARAWPGIPRTSSS